MQEEKQPYITITHGMRGYFAVKMWWNPDMGGFWEPFNTSDMSYAERAGAEVDAKIWAKAEELEYRGG